MSSLTALARALDVELSRLIAQPTALARRDDGQASVLAVRDAITALEDFPGLATSEQVEDEPPVLDALGVAVRRAEAVRQGGGFAELGGLLPGLLAEARSAAREYQGDEQLRALGLLSEVFQIAATMMTALAREDLGHLAMLHAQVAAERSGDGLLQAGNLAWLSWILFKQGRLEEAERVAVVAAERVEPDFVRGPPRQLAVWGVLLLRAASAAVRAGQPDRGEEQVRLAQAAAVRLGRDVNVYATPFGPTNAAVAAVNLAVESGRFARALQLSRLVPGDGWVTPTWRSRYLIDVAIAQSQTRRLGQAVDSLLEAERIAPEWMRYHTLARDMVRELAEREGRRRSRVQQLAERLHVEL